MRSPRQFLIPLTVLLSLSAFHAVCAAVSLPSTGTNGQGPTTALVFYADPQVSDSVWPLLFQNLLGDLSSGGAEWPEGVVLDRRPAILRGSEDLRGISFQQIISVKLLGRCDLFSSARGNAGSGPLGWVLRVSGKVQPYIYIDCARLARVLEPAMARMSKQRQQCAMEQAVAHVILHEWVHIATQSSRHSNRGLTQPNLSLDELIGDSACPADDNRFSAATH